MFKKFKDYLKSIFAELKRVELPQRSAIIGYLIIVIVLAIFSSTMFFLIDMLSFKIIHSIIHLFI